MTKPKNRSAIPTLRIGKRESKRIDKLFEFADFDEDGNVVSKSEAVVEMMMAFLELDAEYDAARLRSANSPTSPGLFDRANMAATARNEARATVLEFIKKEYPNVRPKERRPNAPVPDRTK